MADYIHELADNVVEVLDRIEAQRDARINGPDALSFLQSVYKNPEVPLGTRIRCASIALPFEAPKLTAVANISPLEFSNALEKAINRSGVRLLSGNGSANEDNGDADPR
jgi:hypothetical protein